MTNARHIVLGFLWLVLFASGCSSDGTIDTAGETSASESGSGASLIVIPGADLSKSDVEVTCRSGPSFPAFALADIPLIEDSGLSGVTRAIEPFLGSAEGDFWPQVGWRVLHATDDEVLLVHLADPAPADGAVSHMTVQGSDGDWRWTGASGASPCPVQTATPEGLNTVEWVLDPDLPLPDRAATSFQVLATERECVSGQPMGDRMVGPDVVVTDGAVLVAFAATRPPGDQDCPGNPARAVTIELDEPLGDRVIRDGFDVGVSLADFIN